MEILLASNNKNKHKELLKIFQEAGSKHTLKVNKDIPDVIEDKNTIEENAKKKAEECYKVFKSPIISDDSGLFVDALDGRPGVHSKRYAGLNSTDVENNQKLISELKTAHNLSAFFKTVLCYFDGLNFLTSEGVLKGNIDAELVSIAGKFDGQVLSEVVSIRSTGSVTGEVSYDNISIEEGAKVEAQLGKKKQ